MFEENQNQNLVSKSQVVAPPPPVNSGLNNQPPSPPPTEAAADQFQSPVGVGYASNPSSAQNANNAILGWFSDFRSVGKYWDIIISSNTILFINIGKTTNILFYLLGLMVGIVVELLKKSQRAGLRSKMKALDYSHLLMSDFDKFEIPAPEIASTLVVKKGIFRTKIFMKTLDGETKKFISTSSKEGRKFYKAFLSMR